MLPRSPLSLSCAWSVLTLVSPWSKTERLPFIIAWITLGTSLSLSLTSLSSSSHSSHLIVSHLLSSFSREIYGNPISPLDFELDDGPAIEALLSAYPNPIQVSDLPHASEEEEDKIGIADALFKEGLLIICDEMSKPKNEDAESDDDCPF